MEQIFFIELFMNFTKLKVAVTDLWCELY